MIHRKMQVMLIAVFALCVLSGSSFADKVKIDVYYETLCPDSIKYLTKTVFPVYNSDVGKHIELQLYPYGKSKVQMHSDNEYMFDCHHGAKECYGNKIHACALKTVSNPFMLIKCLLADTTPVYSNEKLTPCYRENDINMEDSMKIEKCANSTEGDKYLYEYGQMTDMVQNPLRSVPFTVFNKDIDESVSAKSFSGDFLSIVCKSINDPNLAECKNLKSSAFFVNLSIVSTLISSILFLFV